MRIATAVLVLLTSALPVAAQDVQEHQVSGAAGWAGRVLKGEPAPVVVDLDNRGKKNVDLIVAVTWAGAFTYQAQSLPAYSDLAGRTGPVYHVALTLPAKSRKRISLSLVTPDGGQSSVWAYAIEAKSGKTLAGAELPTRTLEPNKRIVAVVGTSRPDGLEDATIEVANISPSELPEDWQAYSSLKALVWMDGRATEIRSTAQVDALRQWISTGGTFCVARGNTIDLGGTPIADLLPVKLGATRELASLGGGALPEGPAIVIESTVRNGAIRAESEGVPLVVEGNREAGRVAFAAFDPGRAPFTGWSGAKPFWKWLLSIGRAGPLPRQNEDLGSRAIGSQLLSQQAGRFPDVAAPEIGGLFLLIILYLIVVGPLDYGILRMFRRLEFTWFTFPAYVVIFTFFILLVGGAFIQRAAHQREIAVIDHYPESSFVRRRALSAVLAPADVLYKIEDALPLSSNFIKERETDTASKVTDVRMIQATPRIAENWLLNRNYTGLAMADRCGSEPSPLTFTIASQENTEVALVVKNGTGETFESSALVTPRGFVYTIPSIPPGESRVAGSRHASTVAEYVQKEGQRAKRADESVRWNSSTTRYRQQDSEPNAEVGIKEAQLNPLIQKALIGLCFPAEADTEHEILSGMARSLDAKPWLATGGSILLVWPKRAEAVVRFEPKPGRHTSVTLYRFFQGPPP